MTAYTHVKEYQRTIGKRCMHCGRSATVRAYLRTRKPHGSGYFKLPVRFCREHAVQVGAIEEEGASK